MQTLYDSDTYSVTHMLANAVAADAATEGGSKAASIQPKIARLARHGFEMPDALDVAAKTYVDVNIHKTGNESIAASLSQLPGCCVDSAASLERQRAVFEAHDVFSPGMIDGVVAALRAYDDKNLRAELMKSPERLAELVERHFNCG